MPFVAKLLVRGRGLLVTAASPAAEALFQRPLVGMPLTESIWEPEYASVIDRIRWTVTRRLATTEIVQAPNGTVGRVLAVPSDDATVTFAPLGYAIHEVYGPDLICGEGNDAYRVRAARPSLGLPAREAYPEPYWQEAQDALDFVMRRGGDRCVTLPSGRRMLARLVRFGVVRTVAE